MKKIKQIILWSALVSIIFLAIYCLHLTERLNKSETLINDLILGINKSNEKLKTISHSIKVLSEDFKSEKEIENEYVYLTYKKAVSDLINKNISNIITEKPMHGGKWFVTKVNFIGPSFAYIEYEDGHEGYVALIQIIKTDEGFNLFPIIN